MPEFNLKQLFSDFEAKLPFGMTQRQQNAWMYHGGGLQRVRDFMRDYGIVNFPGGNTGVQMGGRFRKEIKTVKDLKGLKNRPSAKCTNPGKSFVPKSCCGAALPSTRTPTLCATTRQLKARAAKAHAVGWGDVKTLCLDRSLASSEQYRPRS
jgi:hypothetical protein